MSDRKTRVPKGLEDNDSGSGSNQEADFSGPKGAKTSDVMGKGDMYERKLKSHPFSDAPDESHAGHMVETEGGIDPAYLEE